MTVSWAARLVRRPVALEPHSLDLLMRVRAEAGDRPHSLNLLPEPGYRLTDSGIAVVSVVGPLVARGDWLTQLLGASDYTCCCCRSCLCRAFVSSSGSRAGLARR